MISIEIVNTINITNIPYRQLLHAKAAKFLEFQPHKCSSCGGETFLNGIMADNDAHLAAIKSRPRMTLENEKANKEGATKKQAMVHETNLGVVRAFKHTMGGQQGPSKTRRISKAVEHLMTGTASKSYLKVL